MLFRSKAIMSRETLLAFPDFTKDFHVYTGILIIFSACNGNKKAFPILKLANENILKISDSIQFNLDSTTIPKSENIYLIDSFLYIANIEASIISKININTNKILSIKLQLNRFGEPQIFQHIFVQNEKIVGLLTKSSKGFIFNIKGIALDSFLLSNNNDVTSGKIVTDNPLVSTIQPLLLNDSFVYSLGFALIEGKYVKDESRFILCASNRLEKTFYVNYPKSYFNKNWGGTYLRMTYSTTVGDSLIVISFPASNEIAVFNTKTRIANYINCFPNIDTLITPVADLNETKTKQINVAKHFFKQYSFQALIFDRYRNVYYRILNKPMPIKNDDGNSIGNLNKLILVYDNKFSYLGYKEIQGSLYSNTTLLIHPKGLLIQKLKNNNDEEHINFDLFSIDSSSINILSKKR